MDIGRLLLIINYTVLINLFWSFKETWHTYEYIGSLVTTHNLKLLDNIPCVILGFIAFPSFGLLYDLELLNNPNMTIKAVGHQWYGI